MTEKLSYCAIIETTLTDKNGKKRTFWPEKVEGLNDNCPFLTLKGTYDDGTKWQKQINKTAVMSIDIKENTAEEIEQE